MCLYTDGVANTCHTCLYTDGVANTWSTCTLIGWPLLTYVYTDGVAVTQLICLYTDGVASTWLTCQHTDRVATATTHWWCSITRHLSAHTDGAAIT